MPSEPASSTLDTLALLELPALDGLTEAQARGADCVWCPQKAPTHLTAETAVNLGERRHRRPGGRFSTFPRACRACFRQAAAAALRAHAGSCEQGVDDAALCGTATALRALKAAW
ncbi:hypothetical protein [Streptomyces sp. NPDC101237]|uniref:hypothetical protein n=1 Tax=Streptomyces sp. NPDC101237 TaxID=3366139 RepID=UPI0037F14062